MTERQTTVFLVDDHPGMRAGWRSQVQDECEVVGEADHVDAAIDLIREREPDVVLLDIHLPGGGGARVIEQVLDTHNHVRFLAVSMSDDREDVLRVVAAGASGYLTKNVEAPELVAAIERVASGDPVFSPQLAGLALELYGSEDPEIVGDELAALTEREIEVLRLIARGYTYREIGEDLYISVKTVETHMRNILRKLQLVNRHQLAAWAARHGIR